MTTPAFPAPAYFPQGYPLYVVWHDEEADADRVSRVVGWQIQTGRSSPVLPTHVLPAVLPGGAVHYDYFEDVNEAMTFLARTHAAG